MTPSGLGTFGVSLNVDAGNAHLRQAAELEALGYSAIWLPGGQLDRLDRVTELISATQSTRVVTGVVPTGSYGSAAVSQFYAELESTSPGRFVVGLGATQAPQSLAAMNDYLDQLGTAVPQSRRLLAALGPRKLELARDRFGGAITLLVTPEYTAAARRTLGADSVLVVQQMVVLDSDADRAREAARVPLSFLSSIKGYTANFERMGFTQQDISELSDRLVDELVSWGDATTIVNRLQEHQAAGADHVVLSVLSQPSQPGTVEVAKQLAAKLSL